MNFTEVLQNLSSKAILIVGDVMIDEYIWGGVDRISPEAPVPVVSVKQTESRLGGAANVAKNIKGLGVEPIVCSVIGTDSAGEKLKEIFLKRGIESKYLIESKQRKTTIKTRVLSGNHQILRIDSEDSADILEQEKTLLLNSVQQIIKEQNVGAIILQDYNKGVLNLDTISQIISLANSLSIPILVDPKKQNFFEYKNVAMFKPNFKEFTEGIGVNCEKQDVEKIHSLAKDFMRKQSVDCMMITLSEHGIFIADQTEYVYLPTQVRKVSDVSGAGDTVISVATICYMANLSLSEIARISNIAAGIVCEIPGVVSIQKEQLLQKI